MKEDRVDVQKVITDLQREIPKIKNENDFEHLIRKYLEEQIKDVKNEINIEPLIETVLEHLKIVSNVKPLSEDDEFDKILEDTIKLCFVHKFESELAFEAFKELAKYDKVFHANQGKFFYKIYQMLSIMVQYKELIKKLENLENETVHKRGIAKTSYEDIYEAIQPNLNHYEKAVEINDIQENKLANNIAQAFNSNPREMNAVLETFDVNLIKYINESEKKTFKNQNTFYNSSEKLEDIHLFRSCQITCYSLFQKRRYLRF